MAYVCVFLSGELVEVLYKLSATYVVSLETEKKMYICLERLDMSKLHNNFLKAPKMLKYIQSSDDIYCPNNIYDVHITCNDLIKYVPRCRKGIEMIGKFNKKEFLINHKLDLIDFYELKCDTNLDNSKFIYIDNNVNNYKLLVNDLIENTTEIIYLIIDNVDIQDIEGNDRIKMIKNEDDYTKLCIMANCKKGGYYTGDGLGWWGSFLNKFSESMEISKYMEIENINEAISKNLYPKENLEHSELPVFILLPTYNRGEKCINVINQILDQTYKNWKLCILDDGSSNKDSMIIKSRVDELGDSRIFYLRNVVNMKLVRTLNRGIDIFLKSKYDLFTWISDDNLYFPDFIKNLAVKDKDFIYSGHIVKSENQIIHIKKQYGSVKDVINEFAGLGSFMWSKKAIEAVGYFNYSLTLLEDFDYLIRTFFKLGIERTKYIDVLNMEYDSHDESLYKKNKRYVKDKHTELVLFYSKINLSKPLVLYYTKENSNIHSGYNKIFVRKENTIEYNAEEDMLYICAEYLDLVLNLFNLIDKKIIWYDNNLQTQNIIKQVNKYKNVELINSSKVSIVMTYFSNRKEQTIRTLNRFEQLYVNKYIFEVIIVDDNSLYADRLDDIIVKYSYPIIYKKITKQEKGNRINPCSAYNIGFKLATGKYVMIQNPECYHSHDLLSYAINNSTVRNYLTYSCFSGNSEEYTKELINQPKKIHTARFLNKNKLSHINWYNHPTINQTNYHFCSVMMKDNIDLISGFDERYANGYCFDDNDFLLLIKYVLRLNIECIDPSNGFVVHQYHVRNLTTDDPAINIKWENNKKIFEEKQNFFEKSNFNYPRLLHLYWDGSPLSFLNLCTILSFNDYHSNWAINIYMPTKKTETNSWISTEQKLKYDQKCYLNHLKLISNVNIHYVDFENIGFINTASEVIKSDYFRYYILYKHGGVWSDFDIIYTCNIEEKIKDNSELYIFRCIGGYKEKRAKYYYPIGWFLAQPETEFLKYIMSECVKNYNPKNYQTLGATLFSKLFPKLEHVHNNVNYNTKITILNKDYYLPWAWNELDEFLVKLDNTLPANNFGIHWFNGADDSKKYAIELTKRIHTGKFIISCYLDKFVNKYLRLFYNLDQLEKEYESESSTELTQDDITYSTSKGILFENKDLKIGFNSFIDKGEPRYNMVFYRGKNKEQMTGVTFSSNLQNEKTISDKKMKIFVFGSNGMLGNYMCSVLSKKYTVISLTRNDYDLSNLEIDTLEILLKEKELEQGDLVINCAGVIPQASKQQEVNKNLYFKVNSLFPVVLNMLCNKLDARMINITTDCVFDGKVGQYSEKSKHTEINDYGISKSLGELCGAMIIRTSIIGEEKLNKRSLLEWVKSNSGTKINGFTKHYWNGVTCLELAKVVLEVIERGLFWKGVRHIHSPTSVSKYELLKIINDTYGLSIEVVPFETELVDKTLTTVFDEKLQIKELVEQIKELKEYKF